MTSSPRLVLRQLSKAYAAPVLRDVHLTVAPGEVHALVGENGAGKSTLCRILAGLARADAGDIQLDGQPYAPHDKRAAELLGVRLVRQELAQLPTLTVAESIFLANLPTRRGFIDRRRLRADAERLLALVGLDGLDPDTLTADLGVGQQQALEIAAALTRPCRVLMLDEPTAALSHRETERLFAQIARLRAEGTSLIYISHRLEELPRIADRVSVLRDGVLVATGRPTELSRDQLVQLMVGRAREATATDTPVVGNIGSTHRVPATVHVAGLRAGRAVADVSFVANPGEILGLGGLVGAGRTETLRALFGADHRDAGTIRVNGETVDIRSPADAVALGFALVPEDRKHEGLLLSLTVRENLALGRLPAHTRHGLVDSTSDAREATALAQALGVRGQGIEQTAGELSGGNQQKVLLARCLALNPRVLLIDEPTRGIDVGARAEIHRLLRALALAGKTLIVVSSDMPELLALADRIVVLSLGHVTATLTRAEATEDTLLAAALARHTGPATDHPLESSGL